ncbi:unnamed protein product, partial [Nippostrongylus brasiliensis]|uniref:Alpha-catulin (inferred by orthology to a human protein) n=1 Tax=Nippostrongylus brasiliensis TaxID=27835 RepID=A0A0N4XIJ2_NIPBR
HVFGTCPCGGSRCGGRWDEFRFGREKFGNQDKVDRAYVSAPCVAAKQLLHVLQITTLVNFKESYLLNGKPKSERAIRAALKVGSAVEAAIERFVAVGETIADENPDIQPEMYDACHEARLAGASIANLSCCSTDAPDVPLLDKSVLVRASRQLLSSVTRVLLLADRVLVKHILRAEDKVGL